MSDITFNPKACSALLDANSLVTAGLLSDYGSIIPLLPRTAREKWLVLALTKLNVEMLKLWAEAAGEDPEELWKRLATETVRVVS